MSGEIKRGKGSSLSHLEIPPLFYRCESRDHSFPYPRACEPYMTRTKAGTLAHSLLTEGKVIRDSRAQPGVRDEGRTLLKLRGHSDGFRGQFGGLVLIPHKRQCHARSPPAYFSAPAFCSFSSLLEQGPRCLGTRPHGMPRAQTAGSPCGRDAGTALRGARKSLQGLRAAGGHTQPLT